MKKIYLTLVAMTLCSLAMLAQQPAMRPANIPDVKLSPQLTAQLQSHEQLVKDAQRNPAGINRAPVVDGRGFIVEAEGEKMDYMLQMYEDIGFGFGAYGGIESEVYYNAEDGSVYIKDLLRFARNGAYVRGHLDGDMQDGIITIESGALCGDLSSFGADRLYVRTLMYDEEQDAYVVDTISPSFQLVVQDGYITTGQDLYLVGVDDNNGAYLVQAMMTYIPIDLSTMVNVTVPEGATTQYYTMSVCEMGTTTRYNNSIVRISRLGDEFYFSDVFGSGYGYVFHGTLKDGVIEVETPQFVKSYNYLDSYNVYVFFNTCTLVPNEEHSGYNGFTINEPGTLRMTFDEEMGTIAADDTVMIALLEGNFSLSAYYFGPMFVPLDEELPVVPDDAVVNQYWLHSEYDDQGNHQGALVKIARAGNDFYFMDADGKSDEVIFKGTLDPSTNVITADARQVVGVVDGTLSRFGVGECFVNSYIGEDYFTGEEKEIYYLDYQIDEDAEVATFTFDPETGNIKANNIVCTTDDNYSYLMNRFQFPYYTLLPEPANSVPEGSDTLQYVFTAKEQGNSTASIINVMRNGDDLYFEIPTEYDLSAMTLIKGTLDGDKVHVKIPQFVAPEGKFLCVGEAVESSTQNEELEQYYWTEWRNDDSVTSIDMTLDSETGVISYDGNLHILNVSEEGVKTKCYGWDAGYIALPSPVFTPFELKAATPADPYNLSYNDKEDDYWGGGERYCFNFYMALEDVDGAYLPSDSLSYRIFMDDADHVYVFTPENYPDDFLEDVTEVWYTQPASGDLPHPYNAENARCVYLRDWPEKQIGVQTRYHFNGDVFESNIVWLKIGSGIEEVVSNGTTATVVGYYDLQGRQLTAPSTTGITIVKMSDGTARKILVK